MSVAICRHVRFLSAVESVDVFYLVLLSVLSALCDFIGLQLFSSCFFKSHMCATLSTFVVFYLNRLKDITSASRYDVTLADPSVSLDCLR